MSSENLGIDINRYKIENKIGEGGFSKVYRIKDLKTKKYYAAKISNFMIDEDTQNSQETLHLFREVNLMSLFDHPSIIKFIGYYPNNFENEPLPTIITELSNNGSLRDIIEMEISGLSPEDWDDTKRLINIYGIASGMSYLHAHNILHRDLKPENILMNDYLYPLISDFGLSKITDFLSISMNIQSQKGLKGTPIYMAPEILSNEEYSKPGDVYAFAFIVYEIMTRKRPFGNKKMIIHQLIKKIVIEGYRPDIDDDVPNAYRTLIEKCWSQKAEDRPSFDDIIQDLKNNGEFLTELTDKLEFDDYVDYVENYQTTFDTNNRRLRFADFVRAKGRNKSLRAISLKKFDDSDENEEIDSYSEMKEMDEPQNKQDINISKENSLTKVKISNSHKVTKDSSVIDIHSNPQKITEDSSIIDIHSNPQKIEDTDLIVSDVKWTNFAENIGLYPIFEYNNLNEKCQNIVKRAVKEPEQQFIVGKSLIEEENDFPQNIHLGLKYIEQSLNEKCVNSILYYVHILIKGDIIPQDLKKADQYLSSIPQDKRIFVMKGRISRKKTKYTEAVNYFNEGSKAGDIESMFEYGKMLFLGEGVKKSIKGAMKYFNLSKDQGYKKSEHFINCFNKMNHVNGFSQLPVESQLFFITNNIKNIEKHNLEFNEIIFSPHKTEILYFNKSLKSSYFHDCINAYNNIYFEMKYASTSFKMINDLVNKIISKFDKKNIKNIIVLSSFDESTRKFSYIKIDKSINIIQKQTFLNCYSLKKMIIPSSVTSIGYSAFGGCESLTQITIPSSVTSIGYSAFCGCESLTQITIPSSVTSIGNSAFSGCSSLTQITIPPSVTSIGNYAFFECSSLTQITIPSSVTEIEDFAFFGCSSLTQITIPSSITEIGNNIFSFCSSLTQITIPSSVTSIGNSVFSECSSLTQITIPSSVTEIGDYSFSYCSSLAQITIPSSLTSIGEYAFSECSSLAQIRILSSVTSIRDSAFSWCSSLTRITIPSSVTSIEICAFCGCESLTQIAIPSSVTSIGDSAFSECLSLTQITIPSSITSIGNYVFSECLSLTQITIPSSVTSIGNYAFSECSSLTQITIPSSVTSIGNYALASCPKLDTVTVIPCYKKRIKYFENKFILFQSDPFNEIYDTLIWAKASIDTVIIPEFIKTIGNTSFYECSSLAQITIPSSVTSIGDSAFRGCSSLTQITIPSSVTSIGYSAFRGCSSLTQITIPSSVTSIGDSAFRKCSSLTQITIPSPVTSIGDSAFRKCSLLTQITIPSSITSIGDSAFRGCSLLTQITIPSSVISIGDSSFFECSSLTQITIPSSVTSIGDSAFYDCLSLAQITILSSAASFGYYSFGKCSSLKQINCKYQLNKYRIGIEDNVKINII